MALQDVENVQMVPSAVAASWSMLLPSATAAATGLFILKAGCNFQPQ
jgi:hypothetical protein